MSDQLFSASATGERLAVTTTSGSTSIPLDANGSSVRFVNHGPDTAYVSIGYGPQTAAIPTTGAGRRNCCTVLAGSDITLGLANAQNFPPEVAALTASGTATLDVFISNGM